MGIGRQGRSCAWPPSRGVTSKSPMNAGAASSLGVHARVARRARQRRRVYQSGKGTAANRGGSGWWPVCSARDLPRPAPRQRPGSAYGLVLLGHPPSFDEDDSDPHCCVMPLDAVALPSRAATAACRTRHGPAASCSAPMASRLRYLVTVYGPGCLPGHCDYLKRHDSLGFDAGRLLRPVVPRERSEGLARPPTAVSDVHAARDRAHGASGSIRPRRPSTERRGASVPTRVHPPPQLRHTRVSRHCALAPRRRHPQAMAPRLRRISTGCLVSQSVGMAPDHAATGRLPHGCYDSASTKAAPEKSSYHPCRCCAPGRLSAPSLPHRPTRRHAAQDDFGRFPPP